MWIQLGIERELVGGRLLTQTKREDQILEDVMGSACQSMKKCSINRMVNALFAYYLHSRGNTYTSITTIRPERLGD